MSFKQPPELYEIQSDALGENLSANPNLAESPIASKNKKLKTAKQFITGAINELLVAIDNMKISVNSSLGQQQSVLGDFTSDPELVNELNKIDVSVIKGLVKIYKDINNDLDNPKDISSIAPSIKEAIIKLSNDINTAKCFYDYKDKFSLNGATDPINDFVLTFKPIKETIKLYVNGIKYDHTYNPDNKTVSWIFNLNNGGFNLVGTDFEIEIIYDYFYSENIPTEE